jgi:hypothetical protein
VCSGITSGDLWLQRKGHSVVSLQETTGENVRLLVALSCSVTLVAYAKLP